MEDNPVLEQALLEEAFIEEAFLAEAFMEEAFMARVRDMEEERKRESEMLQQLQREVGTLVKGLSRRISSGSVYPTAFYQD